MANHWIKIYTEILHDPKMGRLSEHLWNVTIKIFMAAGDNGKDGELPSLADMTYIFRTTEEILEADLLELESIGITTQKNGRWLVSNFAKRQAPSEATLRVRRYREEHRKKGENTPAASANNVTCNVTKTLHEKSCNAPESESESESEAEAEAEEEAKPEKNESASSSTASDIFRQAEDTLGPLPKAVVKRINRALQEYPPEWVVESFSQAAVYNKRSWAYCEAMLRRWRQEGFPRARDAPPGCAPGDDLPPAPRGYTRIAHSEEVSDG